MKQYLTLLRRPGARRFWPALGVAGLVFGWLALSPAQPSSVQSSITPPITTSAAFLKIDGIAGESTAAGQKDAIDILSFSWGAAQVANTLTVAAGAGAGRTEAHALTITKRLDKSSPALMLACAGGKHLKTAVLTLTDSSDPRRGAYFTVTLTDARVSSYAVSHTAGGDDRPVEQITLNFTKIRMDYRDPADTTHATEWDFMQ